MKIRTKLTLLSSTFLTLIILMSWVVYHSFTHVQLGIREIANANKIIKHVSEFELVMSEFLMYNQQRSVDQWKISYNFLGKLLLSAEREVLHGEKYVEDHDYIHSLIRYDYEILGNLFSKLVDNANKRRAMLKAGVGGLELDLNSKLNDRIVTQILMRSQKISSNSFKLFNLVQKEIDNDQRIAKNGVSVLITLGVFFVALLSYLMISSIISSIKQLQEGAYIVGKGNLDHSVNVKTKDEMKDLAQSFNLMTENLKNITTSRDKFEKALAEIKVLQGMIPICARCKKIRNDEGYWMDVEAYVQKHTDAEFTHGLCENCNEQLYGDQEWYKKRHPKKNK